MMRRWAKRLFYIALVLLSFRPVHALAATSGSTCKDFGAKDRARLIEYVQKKYKVPTAILLAVNHVEPVGSTCFRKLEFKSINPKSGLRVELFLSPDLRFLTAELLDSSVDPILDERRKHEALTAGLTHGNFPSRGPSDSKVTLTVFSDFQCPYCAKLARMLNQEVLPAEGKNVRLVFRQFPLPMHNWATTAAQATACAQEQGDNYFWQLHDFLFEHQREFNPDNVTARLTEEGKRLRGFDSKRFSSCVAEKKTAANVEADIAFGTQSGVAGTPTMFVNAERTGAIVAPEQLRTLIRQARSKAPLAEASLRATVPR
jgi:protein-disulfide isomerase